MVWQAPTRTLNPTVPESLIAQALDDDPARAQAEYLAQFRCDIESFVSIEAVHACVETGIFERPPRRGVSYFAFCDPSGGSADSITLAIGHREIVRRIVVIDVLLEIRPPF